MLNEQTNIIEFLIQNSLNIQHSDFHEIDCMKNIFLLYQATVHIFSQNKNNI